jgi:hypothetical protein
MPSGDRERAWTVRLSALPFLSTSGASKAFIVDLTEVVVAAVGRQRRPEARMAAAVREHVVVHGLHARAAFATDSEIRALSPANRERYIAARDIYQDRFIELIKDGVRDGVFAVRDVRIASYAILLQCTGVIGRREIIRFG